MAACSVIMGPVTFNDLSDEKLAGYIHKTQKVSVKFGKLVPQDDFKGWGERAVTGMHSKARACV